MKLLIRILIFLLIGALLTVFVYKSNPHLYRDDLYLVSGRCIRIDKEFSGGKNSDYRMYIVMDDRSRYYIYDYIWYSFDDALKENLVGENITFFASDKPSHWVLEHLFISLGDDENDCSDMLDLINKKNLTTRMIIICMYTIVFPFVIIGPEFLRFLERRDMERNRSRYRRKRKQK